MLQVADAAIGKGADGKSTSTSSCCSSVGTDFRPISGANLCVQTIIENKDTAVALANGEEEQVQITNLALMEDRDVCKCLFAENSEHVEFYLPLISVECACCAVDPIREEEDTDDKADPCALESILRPWQVEFLADEGIRDVISFVHTQNRRGGVLANNLRKWRKKKGYPTIRKRSCGVALHIWIRTCKSVVRNIRSQRDQGIAVPRRPEFLELNIWENKTAILFSSLG